MGRHLARTIHELFGLVDSVAGSFFHLGEKPGLTPSIGLSALEANARQPYGYSK